MSRGTVQEVNPTKPRSLMGTSEVAEELGVPRSTIARWIKSGVLPRPQDSLRATPVWRRSDIERFKAKQEREQLAREQSRVSAAEAAAASA